MYVVMLVKKGEVTRTTAEALDEAQDLINASGANFARVTQVSSRRKKKKKIEEE